MLTLGAGKCHSIYDIELSSRIAKKQRIVNKELTAVILRFFPPNSVALGADYVKVVEDTDRPILSATEM